jgi:hypothetical protein
VPPHPVLVLDVREPEEVLEAGNVSGIAGARGYGLVVRYCGKITGSTIAVVKMQRSLWPHSGTMIALCFAPSVVVT